MSKTTKKMMAKKARSAHGAMKSALDWVTASADAEVAGNQRLVKRLRSGIYQTNRLVTAAESKMCVGVYGPSQAGKSYLVSALARKQGERLVAMIGDREVDFIEAINPEGGKESTGLVTRFTLDHDPLSSEFPIRLKLLGELDLIKLFVNSYVNDIEHDEDDQLQWHQEQVQRVLSELEAMPRGFSPLTIEDVYELEDYCNGRFSSNFRIQALKRIDFWQRAAELLPMMGDVGRLRVVQLLWEDLPSYSGLYASLVAELARLSHAGEVHGAPEALFNTDKSVWTRSESSIINVSTLDDLGKQDAKMVNVSIAGGSVVSIALPSLCALTSELVIPMRDKPHPVFDRADLLDFPGARSRKKHPKRVQTHTQVGVHVENFLRGKVAYLFDKYAADLELTSMVLCIGPSNQEVVGLDAMIEGWIERTHGEKPEDRAKLKTALFLVLTKFDQEFSEGPGRSLDGSRWSTRLQASLLNSFGAHAHRTNWVAKWTTSRGFNNIFWLRNPNADQSGLIEYEGTPGGSRETGYSQRKASVIATLKTAFLANSLVQQHFADPLAAWDAGMALNDGGASFLLGCLDEACTDDLKLRQIDQRVNHLLSDSRADLARYYASSDFESLEREKLEFAKELTQSLAQQYTRQRLGEFIDFLRASDIEAVDTFKRTLLEFEREKHARRHDGQRYETAVPAIDGELADELGLDMPEGNQGDSTSEDTRHRNFPEIFVQRFFNEWRARCIARLSSVNLSDYLIAERDLVMRLLNELEIAARRDGLMASMVALVERNYQYKPDDRRSWIWRQTAALTARFNAFLSTGGLLTVPGESATITTLKGPQRLVFQAQPDSPTESELLEIQVDYSERYLRDWIHAVQHSIRINARFQAGITADTESNRQLGRVLEDISLALKLEMTPDAI